MTSSRLTLVIVPLLLAGIGCSGRTLNVGSNQSTDQFTAQQVQAAQAACNAPHGLPDSPATVGDKLARLEGGWWLCSTNYPSEDHAAPVIFSTAGDAHVLVADGSGGLVEATGLDNQGTYSCTSDGKKEVANSEPASACNFIMWDFGGGEIDFETSPRRMRVIVPTAAFEEWYVRLGH
jgi:hypothetical protein